MTLRKGKKKRLIAFEQMTRHEKYGFTSLETLSTWNIKLNKNKNSNFICRKESQLISIEIEE